jgi:hypothetical protein
MGWLCASTSRPPTPTPSPPRTSPSEPFVRGFRVHVCVHHVFVCVCCPMSVLRGPATPQSSVRLPPLFFSPLDLLMFRLRNVAVEWVVPSPL